MFSPLAAYTLALKCLLLHPAGGGGGEGIKG